MNKRRFVEDDVIANNDTRQISKKDGEVLPISHLGTRSKSGEDNTKKCKPEDTDNQSAEDKSKRMEWIW